MDYSNYFNNTGMPITGNVSGVGIAGLNINGIANMAGINMNGMNMNGFNGVNGVASYNTVNMAGMNLNGLNFNGMGNMQGIGSISNGLNAMNAANNMNNITAIGSFTPSYSNPNMVTGLPCNYPPTQITGMPYNNIQQQPVSLPVNLFLEKMTTNLPLPPLANIPSRIVDNSQAQNKKVRRKSKFTRQQDELIVRLKQKGKSWVEIAEMTKVGSYLAARNRYQVIVGQQGNNTLSSWSSELNTSLKELLDKYEVEKWKYITDELNKIYQKDYDYKEVQLLVSNLFSMNPYSFNVSDDLIKELIKEKKSNERESVKSNEFDEFLGFQMGQTGFES